MDYSKYTERQSALIAGSAPIIRASNREIERTLVKASYNFDRSAASVMEKELLHRGCRIPTYYYTDNQRLVINGEHALNTVTDRNLKILYSTAMGLCDKDVADFVKAELDRRGIWIKDINGYSPRQTQLILGIAPLGTAHLLTVTGLRDSGFFHCDEDVFDYASAELRKRNYSKKTESRAVEAIMDSIKDGVTDFSGERDYDICRAIQEARRKNQIDVVQILEDEVEKRTLKSYERYYTDEEKLLLTGKEPSSYFYRGTYVTLSEKIENDSALSGTDIAKAIANKAEEIRAEWDRPKRIWSDDYTETQTAIIVGEIPIYRAHDYQLKPLINKANRRGDTEIYEFFKAELDARSEYVNDNQPYTEAQQMIIQSIKETGPISTKAAATSKKSVPEEEPSAPAFHSLNAAVAHLRDDEYVQEIEEDKRRLPYTDRQRQIARGIIPLEKTRLQEISRIIDKARNLGDEETADRLERYLEEHAEKRRAFKEKPKTELYTSTQKDVVRGKMPFEAVRIGELKQLVQRAKAAGDIEILELAEALLADKEAEAAEHSHNARKTRYLDDMGISLPKSTNKRRVEKDKDWALRILNSQEDPTFCTMTDLQNIRLLATTLPNEAYKNVAALLIEEKKDRRSVYKPKTRQEAISLLVYHTMEPIRMPEEWLT